MLIEIIVTGALTISAAVTGWMLNELSSWFKLRREDRLPVGNLLVALAEIRYRITVTSMYFERVNETIPIPPEAMPVLRQMMDQLLPSLDSLDKEYDNAITQLSGRNPNLAFLLHSKNRIPSVLSKLRQLSLSEPLAAAPFGKLEEYLITKIIPTLDEVILELAHTHGSATEKQFEMRIRDWNDKKTMSKEMDELINDMIKIMEP